MGARSPGRTSPASPTTSAALHAAWGSGANSRAAPSPPGASSPRGPHAPGATVVAVPRRRRGHRAGPGAH
eukprot:13633151-Alexandrium_andersonii.AAC.1